MCLDTPSMRAAAGGSTGLLVYWWLGKPGRYPGSWLWGSSREFGTMTTWISLLLSNTKE